MLLIASLEWLNDDGAVTNWLAHLSYSDATFVTLTVLYSSEGWVGFISVSYSGEYGRLRLRGLDHKSDQTSSTKICFRIMACFIKLQSFTCSNCLVISLK